MSLCSQSACLFIQNPLTRVKPVMDRLQDTNIENSIILQHYPKLMTVSETKCSVSSVTAFLDRQSGLVVPTFKKIGPENVLPLSVCHNTQYP